MPSLTAAGVVVAFVLLGHTRAKALIHCRRWGLCPIAELPLLFAERGMGGGLRDPSSSAAGCGRGGRRGGGR